jgi:hypothetical protein
MAGLRDRLLRHPSDQKKLRSHIDQFLNDKQAGIKKISLYLAAPRPRCPKPDQSAGLFLNTSFGIGPGKESNAGDVAAGTGKAFNQA